MEPASRVRVRRKPERARYDLETVRAIFDAAPICHVGFVRDGEPVVLPTIHARIEDTLYLHGSTGSGMLNALAGGARVCVSTTLLDGYVLARSANHHSMNYRSAVAFGMATAVENPDERARALHAVVEHIAPGRWNEVRPPNPRELAATLVLRVPMDESSAKVRSGPPLDEAEDYALRVWAGVVPLSARVSSPIPDASPGPLPASVRNLLGL